MHRNNAGAEIKILATLKAGLGEHRQQRFLIRMTADGFDQIAVAFLIIGEQAAQARNALKGPEVIQAGKSGFDF